MNLMEDNPPDVDESPFSKCCLPLRRRFQLYIDKLTPYTKIRWVITLLFLSLYVLRIAYVQGFHIISYALAIYLLSLFISSISPRVDPAYADLLDEEPSLPRTEGDEFRPFIPRLLEANFWYCATRAVIISILCTFVPFLDIPVFWPILVLYFIMLFTVMMKRQIKHMIKYRYMPFTYGKPSHVSGKKTSSVIVS
uniref:Protein RER1 n=1 Tax=Schistocephalus solidus TaxID=70667 RepID=A0A0X3PX27_SCHSO